MKLLLIFLVVLILAGCQSLPIPDATEPSPSPTFTVTPIPTARPTLTPTTIATAALPTLVPNPDTPDRYEQARRLGRGVNLGNALEAPIEGEWGMVIKAEYFALIQDAGFDTVRVPIRWSAHAQIDPPYAVDTVFFERVDWVIDQALRHELNVVINMHHYDELFENPANHRQRFIAIWEAIAKRYSSQPVQLYFELLNEPHGNLTQKIWQSLMADTILTVRRIDNTHAIIVGGADWGGYQGLLNLKLPEKEENIICTFHFYDPMLFTHQGADWVSGAYGTLGVVWPGPPAVKITPVPEALQESWVYSWFSQYNVFPYETNPAGPKPILTAFDWAERLRERLDCPMWLGEFGAYEKADMQSRINWTAFMREQAEARDIPWAYWEFGAGFGIYNRDIEQWNEGLLRALVPGEK